MRTPWSGLKPLNELLMPIIGLELEKLKLLQIIWQELPPVGIMTRRTTFSTGMMMIIPRIVLSSHLLNILQPRKKTSVAVRINLIEAKIERKGGLIYVSVQEIVKENRPQSSNTHRIHYPNVYGRTPWENCNLMSADDFETLDAAIVKARKIEVWFILR